MRFTTISKNRSIFGDSIKLGVFPNKMKLAKVTLIFFKSGKNAFLRNYRPISVLSCFSKIVERIKYIKKHFGNKLFGFREIIQQNML